MALRSLSRPLFRAGPQAVCRTTAAPARSMRRFLNTDTAPVLYSAHASVTGNRNGHVAGDNLALDLAMPKDMGGKGGKTNPEELFAAGYGACFQSAMAIAAQLEGVKLPAAETENVIDTVVHLVGDMKKADLGIRVDMTVRCKGVSKEDLTKVVERTKTICPYSRATQGNVTTNVKVETS